VTPEFKAFREAQRQAREAQRRANNSRLPQFSLKQLLVSSTLIAVGLGIEIWLFRGALGLNTPRFVPKFILDAWPFLLTISPPMVGIGLFSLFGRPILGFFIGLIVQFGLWFVFLAIIFRHG
jgi:hypothetical protein